MRDYLLQMLGMSLIPGHYYYFICSLEELLRRPADQGSILELQECLFRPQAATIAASQYHC